MELKQALGHANLTPLGSMARVPLEWSLNTLWVRALWSLIALSAGCRRLRRCGPSRT